MRKIAKHVHLHLRKPILPGERYNRLTVMKEMPDTVWKDGETCRRVECLCDCGTTKVVPVYGLWQGSTKSCGCLKLENARAVKHGLKKHPLYVVWSGMKQRCYGPNTINYKDYGGRGITICKKWRKDFQPFYDFATSHGWKKGLLIDRIDNDKGYSPDNCRFVDAGRSVRNTRLLIKTNTSGYRGVYKHKSGRWLAGIGIDNNWINLGLFDGAVEAAHARDAKATELDAGHPLNFPDEWTGQP